MRLKFSVAAVGAALLAMAAGAQAQTKGPSSSATPYVVPTSPGWSVTSILTVGDTALNGYKMVGIPDGLGAYDAGGQFIGVTMNHELGGTARLVRAHGATGAFVSHWLIDKNTMQAVAGADLAKKVQLWNGSGFVQSTNNSFLRLCSADLPALSAVYNGTTGKGYQGLIHMAGEESGNEGRAFGFVVTGAARGTAYELPYLGKFSWENSVANPHTGDKTVVIGLDDSTPGQVYVYTGTKQTTGNAIQQAGLHNGQLYGIKVNTGNAQGGASGNLEQGQINGSFSSVLIDTTKTGAQQQTDSRSAKVTEFARPEDGHWADAKTFYFVTTGADPDGGGGPVGTQTARLYKLSFNEAAGVVDYQNGSISMVLDASTLVGTDGATARSFDNITVGADGKVYIQEDPGGNTYIAKTWAFDPASGVAKQILESDRVRFLSGPPGGLTIDEESSGIIEITSLMTDSALYKPGYRFFLGDMQAHYGIPGELVEGGQLYLIASVPEPETYAMMLCGLGLVGFALRRRQRKQNAASLRFAV